MLPSELLSEIERLLEVVRQQQQQIQAQQAVIERLAAQVAQQGERIKELEEELRAQKKLKGKPKLKASQLNDTPAGEAMDYRQLQAYRQAPTAEAKQTLEEGFDPLFGG
jgi:predicted RNase H-like nuclease (RuvC/YqgF family)